MIFTAYSESEWRSPDGYCISRVDRDGLSWYRAWTWPNPKPVGAGFSAPVGDPIARQSCWLQARESAEADHVARGGTIDRPNR